MKKRIIIFLFSILILLPIVLTESSTVVYVLQPNQELCHEITLTSESEIIIISDTWTPNYNVEWNITLFNTTAEEHNLNISYPEELSLEESEFNICISGQNQGEYHGAITIKQEDKTTQLVTWLKVIIETPPQESPPQNPPPVNTGGGSSARSTTTQNQTNTTETSPKETETPQIDQESSNNNLSQITGATTGVIGKVGTSRAIFILVFAIAGLAFLIFFVRRFY